MTYKHKIKTMMKNKKQLLIYTILIVGGVLLGRMIFGGEKDNNSQQLSSENKNEQTVSVWTCSMHPQIKMDKPGKCPICAMNLIPLNSGDEESTAPNKISMSENAMKIAEVQTTIVQKSAPSKEIRLPGKVKPDERKISIITSRFSGRLEKLFVNFTGQEVQQGEKLAIIYSPDLITAQKELFEAIKFKQSNPEYYKAAKNKLKLWSLSEKQIENIEQNGEPQNYFEVVSPLSGTVMKREVALGDYVNEGSMLFEIADLSSVWVLFDAYESDLPWIRTGDNATFEVQSQPGKIFSSQVTFIDPVVNPEARVAYVRTETDNQNKLLKPDMFVHGIIKAKLPLVEHALIVPKSSVLWTGKKAVVYVKDKTQTKPVFEYREITLGEDAGSFYVVKDGLQEGEEIVTNGVFKIDAAAQLAGKQSMMNPEGEKIATGGHAGMDMGGDKKETKGMDMSKMKKETAIDQTKIPLKFKQQLGALVGQYLLLKDKLAADNSKIKAEVKGIDNALQKVDMSLVLGDVHNLWMKSLGSINKDLKAMEKAVNIEGQRTLFSSITGELKKVVEKLGVAMPDKKPLYIDFCPMANNNEGGYWLSTDKVIRNPYLGSKMLKCGDIKKTIK